MPVHPVDKPLGPTSHDVVARARRLLGTRRVGHAGTLDPLATGVLLLLAGDATKLAPWLSGSDKAYLAWIALGASTPTLDAEGPIEERSDPTGLDAARIEGALTRFLALREQRPPAYSAVKRGGEAAHRAARRGDMPELAPRPAGYRRIHLLAFGPRENLPDRFGPGPEGWRPEPYGRSFELPPALAPLPVALVSVEVSAGTYVRSLARDLGLALGVPAHLAGLVRTRSGAVGLERTAPLDTLDPAGGLPEAEALPLPKVTLDDEQARRIRQGQRLPAGSLPGEGPVGLVDPDGRLAAVAELSPDGMRLHRVWPA